MRSPNVQEESDDDVLDVSLAASHPSFPLSLASPDRRGSNHSTLLRASTREVNMARTLIHRSYEIVVPAAHLWNFPLFTFVPRNSYIHRLRFDPVSDETRVSIFSFHPYRTIADQVPLSPYFRAIYPKMDCRLYQYADIRIDNTKNKKPYVGTLLIRYSELNG